MNELTHLEHIKKYIEATVPADVIDGAYDQSWNVSGKGGGHRWLQFYLQKHWMGEDAIKAVEVAISKPNSIKPYKVGKYTYNDGVIGARSLNEFIKDWLAPYLWEFGYDHKNRDEEPIEPLDLNNMEIFLPELVAPHI